MSDTEHGRSKGGHATQRFLKAPARDRRRIAHKLKLIGGVVSVLIVLLAGARVVWLSRRPILSRNEQAQPSQLQSGQGDAESQSSTSDLPQARAGLAKVRDWRAFDHGLGWISAAVFTEPLSSQDEMESIAITLTRRLQERFRMMVARISFYYVEDYYQHAIRFPEENVPGEAAYYQAVARESGHLELLYSEGFFNVADDSVQTLVAWMNTINSDPNILGMSVDSGDTLVMTYRRTRRYGAEDTRANRWFDLIDSVTYLLCHGWQLTPIGLMPELKRLNVRFVDEHGNRIAEISGDRSATIVLCQVYYERYKELADLDDRAHELIAQHRTGILTDETLEAEQATVELQMADWMATVWGVCSQKFNVEYIDQDWRFR